MQDTIEALSQFPDFRSLFWKLRKASLSGVSLEIAIKDVQIGPLNIFNDPLPPEVVAFKRSTNTRPLLLEIP